MVVNFEFLDREPVDNVITCMNYKIDKVIFFGYQDVIDSQSKQVRSYLKHYCDVQNVEFNAVSKDDLQSTLSIMRKSVRDEIERNNQIYFDITGGESLVLVAFGMLSGEYDTPMHLFNVCADRLIELDYGSNHCISKEVQTRKINMNLSMLVSLHGGIINERLHKSIKSDKDAEFTEDAEKIYQVSLRYKELWNPFSDLLRKTMTPTDGLEVNQDYHKISAALKSSNTKLKSEREFNEIIDELADAGVLLNVFRDNRKYKFRFKNQGIKDCLWESGSVLELHTWYEEKKGGYESRVGVHLDWDGVILGTGIDVCNEVDVLSLHGNVPVFISCKSGQLKGAQALHALYELDTVARRFGGKYAKKILAISCNLNTVYLERAREMDIEIRNAYDIMQESCANGKSGSSH